MRRCHNDGDDRRSRHGSHKDWHGRQPHSRSRSRSPLPRGITGRHDQGGFREDARAWEAPRDGFTGDHHARHYARAVYHEINYRERYDGERMGDWEEDPWVSTPSAYNGHALAADGVSTFAGIYKEPHELSESFDVDNVSYDPWGGFSSVTKAEPIGAGANTAIRLSGTAAPTSADSKHVETPKSTAPTFSWLPDDVFGVAAAKRAAASGKFHAITTVVHCSSVTSASALSAQLLEKYHISSEPANTRSHTASDSDDGAQLLTITREVWLPSKIAGAKTSVGFPSVGLGNKLFMYFAHRIAAALLGKAFELFPTQPATDSLAPEVDYSSAKLEWLDSPDEKIRIREGQCDQYITLTLGDWIEGQQEVSRVLVQFHPSFLACSDLMERYRGCVYTWASAFVNRCCKESIARASVITADYWLIHVRTGDVWLEPGESHAINPCYCPAPAWWYKWLALKHKMKKALIITAQPKSTLVQGIAAALQAGGCSGVEVHSGPLLSDFGTLMRGSNIVLTVSSFSWWASFLSAAVPAACRPSGDSGTTRVYIPLTGMLHPRSVHGTHCHLDLSSYEGDRATGYRSIDTHSYLLSQVDDWKSSKQQQADILTLDIPSWFERTNPLRGSCSSLS